MSEIRLQKLDDYRWLIPQTGGMRVPGLVFSSEKMMTEAGKDESPRQVANVACLPGILRYSFAMPDMHWGYGFRSAVLRPSTLGKASYRPAA